MSLSSGVIAALGRGGRVPHAWPPPARLPLPPFPQPETYDHRLPVEPPDHPDLLWPRGNFCGIRLPGAPPVPGGPQDPSLVMACLLDNYSVGWQDQFLEAYRLRGYTHLQRSIGHALYYGASLASFIGLSQRAQQAGLWCDQWILNGGEGDDWAFKIPDQDWGYWGPVLGPYLDALLGAGVVDTACVGWQLDQLQRSAAGNPTLSIIAGIADRLPRTIPLYTHWVNEALAWWKDGGETWTDRYGSCWVHDRFTFWQACQPYVTGGYYQGDTTTARTHMQLFQDRLKDTLDPMCGPTGKGYFGLSRRNPAGDRPFVLVGTEITAQDQFNGVCDERTGDLCGYLVTCATSFNGLGVVGYGNGARRPDGSVL